MQTKNTIAADLVGNAGLGAAGTVGIMAGYFQREVANSGVLKPESDLTAEVGAFGQILRIGPAGGDDITEGMFPDESACRRWNKALAGQQIRSSSSASS